MSPDRPALTITLGEQAGDGESHWLRLEQVRMADEGATMEQAAALIDALYGIEPCSGGMGTGGEEEDEDALPEESEFLEKAREILKLGACGESGVWDAEVDVYRSHQTDGYSLQGERITVGETTPMRRAVTETVELDGASYDLQWPYGGDISVSGGAVVLDVRGSTVNFSSQVRGLMRIRYTAVWDRVKVRVRPAALGQGDPLAGLHYVAGPPQKPTRDDEAASVVAFWRDLAAECALTRPTLDDQGVDLAEIERLCNRKIGWHFEGDCWATRETYNVCNCSGREAREAPAPVDAPAPCPDGVRTDTFLGTIREMGEYVACPGEDDEGLNTEEFFREHCCEDDMYSPLPRCRETREEHRGGEGIEHGPEHWQNIYGPSVRLIPITPEGGRCGELIKTWNVPDPLRPPVLPEKMTVDRNETFTVSILSGGRPPFRWSTPPGVSHIGDASGGFIGIFRANSLFRGGLLTVIDACNRTATCRLLGECLKENLFRPITGNYRATPRDYQAIKDALGINIFDPPEQPYTIDVDFMCSGHTGMEHIYYWVDGYECINRYEPNDLWGDYGTRYFTVGYYGSCLGENSFMGSLDSFALSADRRYIARITTTLVRTPADVPPDVQPPLFFFANEMKEKVINCIIRGTIISINRWEWEETDSGIHVKVPSGYLGPPGDWDYVWYSYVTQFYACDLRVRQMMHLLRDADDGGGDGGDA